MKLTQDLALGLFFTAVGIAAGFGALNYPFGTASRMGPGFFPLMLAGLLTITGLAIMARGRLAGALVLGPVRWRAVVTLPVVVVVFGLVVQGLGLPLAVLVLVVGAASASERFGLEWKAAVGAVVFSVVCALLFVRVLGLPIPMVGAWLPFAG